MNLNKAIIVGNLTRDPDARTLPNGQAVSSFGVATNRRWTDKNSGEKQERTEFHNVVAFRKLAEICNQYLSKGQMVLIEGRLQTTSWEGQDGVKRFRSEIVAENMQMGPRPQGATPQKSPQEASPKNLSEEIPTIQQEDLDAASEEKKDNPSGKEEEVDVEKIPF